MDNKIKKQNVYISEEEKTLIDIQNSFKKLLEVFIIAVKKSHF